MAETRVAADRITTPADSAPRERQTLFRNQWQLQLMILPGLLALLLFRYGPMYGVVMAFQEFQIGDFIGMSEWVGLRHFIDFFTDSRFPLIMRNTLSLSLLRLVIGFPVPIIFAILLNEIRWKPYKRTIQTLSYLPHFISLVVAVGMVMDFLSINGGLLNSMLMRLGIVQDPVLFLGRDGFFWPIVVLTTVWKNFGWGAIIYLAAITSIDPQLYEAAEIDGARRFRKIISITLPSIMPTVTILLILQLGQLLEAGFEQVMLFTNNMRNTMIIDVAEIIDTYVLRVGLHQLRFSYAAAAGFFKSIVAVALIVVANAISRRVSENSLW